MKKIFKFNIHSCVDIITNSSSEIFTFTPDSGDTERSLSNMLSKYLKSKGVKFKGGDDDYRFSFYTLAEWSKERGCGCDTEAARQAANAVKFLHDNESKLLTDGYDLPDTSEFNKMVFVISDCCEYIEHVESFFKEIFGVERDWS